MPLFTWKNEYSVGEDDLDSHHKVLFEIFNALYDKCMNSTDVDCLQPSFEKLIEYSHYHFAAEEQYMRDHGYKDIDSHVEQHKEFIMRIEKLRYLEEDSNTDATRELIAFLGKWLLHHVREEDKKYA